EDEQQRGEQHYLLRLVTGLLAVKLLRRRPGDALVQPAAGHQRLDGGTQRFDRVAGLVPVAVDDAVVHGDGRGLDQPVRRGGTGGDAQDVREVLAAQRARDRGDLRLVGRRQGPAAG